MKSMDLVKQYTSCTSERVSNAIRLDAGVQWGEVYAWLATYNLITMGGYLQGGGHGLLSGWKGMAAAQVLEFDVVTVDGQRQTANACQNKDLFWALRGGSFAIVLMAILRTLPSSPVIGVFLHHFCAERNSLGSFHSRFYFIYA